MPTRLDRALSRPGLEQRLVAAILALGFAARIVWLFLSPAERLRAHTSEIWNVAAAFARTGQLADAFGPGSGPSTHVGPINPIVGGLIYRAFGVGSPIAELILALIAAGVACTLFWLLYRVAVALDIPVVPRLAALAVLALVPFNFYAEVVDFRIRENALSALISAGLLLWLLRLDRAGLPGWRALIGFGLAAAVAFLVNPAIALAAYAGLAFVGLRHLKVGRWPAAAAVLLVAFAAVNGAWIARNYIVFDRLIISRGNFGMELNTANHAAAVDPADPRKVFVDRLKEYDPPFSPEAFALFKTFPNDVVFFDHLGTMAKTWIAANPGDFARVTLRHLRELYFPPAWLFDVYQTGQRQIALKQAQIWLISALGLAALGVGLVERTRRYLFVALTFVLPTLLYIIVQPTLRYRYIFAGLLTYLAMGLAWRLVTGWRGAISVPARSPR